MTAYVEWRWLPQIEHATLFRYDLPSERFEDLQDPGMHVARAPLTPLRCDIVADLQTAHAAEAMVVRVVDTLVPPRAAWGTSLHLSGIKASGPKP